MGSILAKSKKRNRELMKTFGLFMIMWLASILFSFNIWKDANLEEMLKMLLATQIAFIFYKLVKEETKD